MTFGHGEEETQHPSSGRVPGVSCCYMHFQMCEKMCSNINTSTAFLTPKLGLGRVSKLGQDLFSSRGAPPEGPASVFAPYPACA